LEAPTFQPLICLPPLALDGDSVNFDVQNNKPPELVEFEIHPKFFRFAKFLFALHG
jgi:hypothetical protein